MAISPPVSVTLSVAAAFGLGEIVGVVFGVSLQLKRSRVVQKSISNRMKKYYDEMNGYFFKVKIT
ncbi:MAG: hypothetical protein ACJAYJ_004111 [Saprospiraceae bacterium]|jgi:hypothetical protein